MGRPLHCLAMDLLDKLVCTNIDPAMLAQVRTLREWQQAAQDQQQTMMVRKNALLAEKNFKIRYLTQELGITAVSLRQGQRGL